ncbi:MAG: hypothetical protein FWE03_07240 [Firmicutes bacterium]|nr:hypothetical protein [Bacillota bacterium]
MNIKIKLKNYLIKSVVMVAILLFAGIIFVACFPSFPALSQQYTITFLSDDSSYLGSELVDRGGDAIFIPSTCPKGRVFSHFVPSPTNITGNMTVVAIWLEQNGNNNDNNCDEFDNPPHPNIWYDVTFLNWNIFLSEVIML